MQTYVSFIVDNHPSFYYQSELLLWSLINNSGIEKKHILVHCTESVDQGYINYLKENDLQFKIIQPYLDGKYCNKLSQITSFLEKDCNVIMLDTDTYAVENIIPTDQSKVAGKIVDTQNPFFEYIDTIFKKANIDLKIVNTDCDKMPTAYGNLNGGYYFIPNHEKERINSYWKKWAEWLYKNINLLEPRFTHHVDQLSFALAINELNIELNLLDRSYNYPLHQTRILKIDNKTNIRLLHYHSFLDNMGLLICPSMNEYLKRIVHDCNSQIVDLPSKFNECFRKSRIPRLKPTKYMSLTDAINDKKKKIVWHIGASKTGTTSLQFFLNSHREELKKHKIYYAKNISPHTRDPKHQWMCYLLINEQYKEYVSEINKGLETDCSTVIFSTEGLYNHWFDFSNDSKSFLKSLALKFDIQIILYYRELESFMYSLYKQAIKNGNHALYCYGSNMTYDEYMQNTWSRNHANFYSLIAELHEVFGKEKVTLLKKEGDTIQSFLNTLKINVDTTKWDKEKRKNVTLSNREIDWLRMTNNLPFFKKRGNWSKKNLIARKYLSKTVKTINSIFGDIKPQSTNSYIEKLLERELKLLNRLLHKY